MGEGAVVDSLICEYAELVEVGRRAAAQSADGQRILGRRLIAEHAWTEQGAQELLALVNDYGAFALRNALALAVVLGVEDGSRGL